MDDTPRYSVVNFTYGVTTDSQLTVICRTKRFYITLSEQNLHDPKHTGASKYEQEYLQLLHSLESKDQTDFDPDELDLSQAITDWIVTPFFPVFRALAPKLSPTPQTQTLHEYLNRPTSFFTLKLVDGALTPVSTPERPDAFAILNQGMELPLVLLNANVPIFNPSSLDVDWDLESEGAQFPTKVYRDSRVPYFFKPTSRATDEAIEREWVVFDEPDATLRAKWFSDIEHMLKLLLEEQIVWGDAKAANNLIDRSNEAWMIDFGGNYTFGWVDKDKKNTVEGDLQGLQKIKEHLQVEWKGNMQ